ncbi:putative transcription factor At3g04930 [Nicotiana tabacum]|uniref:Transcription factor At3g04930 n=1 Tax=Nicotiana tabacum TaxID=4097 RepID=A0A1S3ZB35_TOBAC
MASVEDQHNNPVYNDDDLDDDVVDEEDDDVDVDDDDDEDSTSSPPVPAPAPIDQQTVTIAVVGVPAQRINEFAAVTPPPAATIVQEKKPSAIDDSRKLFQRLWTDEDEIELLQGFLEYTTQRGGINSSSHHHDTTAFYDQIKSKLQLDFNKNQLVEKLRRLKKKYRNVMSKMASGKDFVFKSSHDQATFEISRKIWSNAVPVVIRGGGSAAAAAPPPPPPPEDGGFDDEDSHLNLNANFVDHSHNGTKTPRSRKRSRGGAVKVEEKHGFIQHYYLPSPSGGGTNMSSPAPAPAPAPAHAPAPAPAPGFTPFPMTAPQATAPPTTTAAVAAATASIPSLIEETVKSCLSPIFKELLNNVTNLSGSRSFAFGTALSPIPLGFGSSGAMNSDMMADEKWRKQQMLELEVYSRRLELVQDQIKAQLEELRSMSS